MTATKTLYVLLVGPAVALGLTACDDRERTFYPPPISPDEILAPVMIVAHRAGMAFAPENTVAGVKHVQRLKVDMLEIDIQVREDEIVVLHDFTLDRTTDCKMDATDATSTIRSSCDAAFRWLPGASTYADGVGFPYLRGKGITIPLLENVVSELSADMLLMVELKHVKRHDRNPSIEQAVDTLLAFLIDHSLENRVWINSSNAYALARIKAAMPIVPTILSWGTEVPKSCHQTVFDAISRGIDGVMLQAFKPDPTTFSSCVQQAHDAKLKVIFWIVNRPEDVRKLLPFRPDGLLTDFPACLAALLHDIRIENPYPDDVPLPEYLPKCG